MMWGYYSSWGGWLIMFLSMVLWVGLLTVIIVLAARWLGRRPASGAEPPHSRSSMEILQQRYARGEIDEATFRRMRDELQGQQPHGEQTQGEEMRPPALT